MRVGVFSVQAESEFNRAFRSIVAEKPHALVMLADRLFLHHRARIADFAARQRLPAVYAYTELVEAGGLMSFGPSYPDMHRRAAYFVDRILKGAKLADLPMEQPTKFELVINRKTAKALGVRLPPSLLVADELAVGCGRITREATIYEMRHHGIRDSRIRRVRGTS